ncbi:sigma-70 family RNA polymerase sigma factor [bacterium]|nr:sigma-70 family RNA polymerase sigma factor [bacterium]
MNILSFCVNSISVRLKPKEISNDSDLIPQIKKGDKVAFQMLVDRHKRRAFYAALGMVSDRDNALDLTQDAWVIVYSSMESFHDGHPFYPWFYRILMNLCKNFLRHKKVVDRVVIGSINDEWIAEIEGNVLKPESLVEEREAKALVWKAIECLSPEHKEVIILAHFENLSYEKIAELTGVAIGTVMSRLYYARKKLAQQIGQYYE